MAFTDASTDRRILNAWGDVEITLSGTVSPGDPLMYSSGWQLATNTSGAPAVLIAGQNGITGDVITAYAGAVIEITHTSTTAPTEGQLIAVADTGVYSSAGSNLQDIGYVTDAGTTKSIAVVQGMITEIDTAGA